MGRAGRPIRSGRGRRTAATEKECTMSISRRTLVRVLAFGAVGLAVVVALVAARPFVEPVVARWLNGEKKQDPSEKPAATTYGLVRDADGHPVQPYVMRLAPEVVKALKVNVGRAEPAGLLPLPAQIGT